MKKITSVLLCALLACVCLLVSCGAPAMKQEGVGFRNPKTGITYFPAPANYGAQKAEGAEAYARIARNGVDELLFYPVEGMNPDQYLVTANGTLLYAEGLKMPTLSELPVKEIGLYDTQVGSNSANITKADTIAAIKEGWENNPACTYQELWLLQSFTSYDLRFFGSGAYSGLYFRLQYLLFEEDACVYVLIEDEASFEDLYPGIPYELETFTGPDASGNEVTERYAVYNFGKELIFDSVTGKCRMVGASLASLVQ